MKMNIVIVGPAFPLRGGIADFNEALSNAFSVLGDCVSIYSFSYQYPGFLFPGKTQFSGGEAPTGMNIHSTINSINPITWFSTAKKIKAEKPDLVIIRYWLPFMAPALGTIAKQLRKANLKVIAITDNVIPHEKRIGDHQLTQYFVRHCDGFVTMSASVLNDLSQFTSSTKKVFLPHPVYSIFGDKTDKLSARKNLSLEANAKYILFFGFIRAYKGLDLLIDAMADQRLKDLNVKLIIAGEFYEDEKPYLEKIKQLELDDSIVLRNIFIPKEVVRDYFCAADLIVQPYKHATQSGITQIAYHFGRPMLVTNVGGLAEIVSNAVTGYVTETNPTAIASAITDFYMSNRETEMAVNVEKEKGRFTWESFVSGVKNLFLDISKK